MFSPSHRLMLTATAWIVASATLFAAEKEGKYVLSDFKHGGGIWAVADAPDGKLCATGGEDRMIRLWDIAKGTEVRKIATHGAVALSWSPDGKMLASAPGGGVLPSIRSCSTPRPARSCGTAPDTPTPATSSPSVPTASCWPRPAWIRPCVSGMLRPARRSASCAATPRRCCAWSFRRTARR